MRLFKVFKKALFPEGIRCIVCSRELGCDNEFELCEDCALLLNTVFCPCCGRAYKMPKKTWKYLSSDFDGFDGTGHDKNRVCDECKHYPLYFKEARAPFVFKHDVKRLIHGFKFGNRRYLAKVLAKFLALEYDRSGWQVDAVVFSPSSKNRLRWRGYNQAQLLAVEFCAITGLALADVLIRRNGKSNSALMNRRKRFDALSKLIRVEDGLRFNGQRILFIDDVLTTGATSNECAKQLLLSGASEVYVLTLATSYLIMDL